MLHSDDVDDSCLHIVLAVPEKLGLGLGLELVVVPVPAREAIGVVCDRVQKVVAS